MPAFSDDESGDEGGHLLTASSPFEGEDASGPATKPPAAAAASSPQLLASPGGTPAVGSDLDSRRAAVKSRQRQVKRQLQQKKEALWQLYQRGEASFEINIEGGIFTLIIAPIGAPARQQASRSAAASLIGTARPTADRCC